LQSPSRITRFASADALALIGEKMLPDLIKEIEGKAWGNQEFRETFAYLVGMMEMKNPTDKNWQKIVEKIEELIKQPQSSLDGTIKYFAINSVLILAKQNIDFVKNQFDLNSLFDSLIRLTQRYPKDISLAEISFQALTFIFRDQKDREQIKKFLLFIIHQSQFPLETKKHAYYALGELGILDEEVSKEFQDISQITHPGLRKEKAVAFYKLTSGTDKDLFLMLEEKDPQIRAQGINGYTEIGLWLKRKGLSPESLENIVLNFASTENASEVQKEISHFFGKISQGDNLGVLRILEEYTRSSAEVVLEGALLALGKLKPRELFVLDRLRDIARWRQSLVFSGESIALACWALGEVGLADFINLEILFGQIKNSQNLRILEEATEAMVKLLSLVLGKELFPYLNP
ncbi:MAG: hypothetical protein ACK4NT_02805, partial [Candidatus Omnitrophota bacterium]